MTNTVCLAQTSAELKFILSNTKDKSLYVIPLDLDVQIYCIKNKINFYNPLNFLSNSFHKEAIMKSYRLIKSINYINIDNYSHRLEVDSILRFRLHSILFLIEIIKKVDKKFRIKKIVVSGWSEYHGQYSNQNYFISNLAKELFNKKEIILLKKNKKISQLVKNNFPTYELEGIKNNDNKNYILLSNIFYNFFRLIRNIKEKNIYFLTQYDKRISYIKYIIFKFLKVKFFKFKKKKNEEINFKSPKIIFQYQNKIIKNLLIDRFNQEKNNIVESIEKGRALDAIYDKINIVSVFSNIARGEYGYYLESATKKNIKSFCIPHGTLAEHFNKYDKIYKNIIAEAVLSAQSKYFAVQSKITEKFLKKNKKNYKFNKIKTGNLIFSENSNKKMKNRNTILFAVTVKTFQSIQYVGVEMYYEFIENLNFLNYFSKESDYKILVKLHPGAQKNIADLKKMYPHLVFTCKKIDNVLEEVFLTISFSSTVIEDSLYSNRPVILFDQWNRYQHCKSEKNLNKKNAAIYYVSDKKDLIKCIKTIQNSQKTNFKDYIFSGVTKNNILNLKNFF